MDFGIRKLDLAHTLQNGDDTTTLIDAFRCPPVAVSMRVDRRTRGQWDCQRSGSVRSEGLRDGGNVRARGGPG